MTKRSFTLTLGIVISFWCANAYALPTLAGDWVGGIDFEKWQAVNFHFVGNDRGFSGTAESRPQLPRDK